MNEELRTYLTAMEYRLKAHVDAINCDVAVIRAAAVRAELISFETRLTAKIELCGRSWIDRIPFTACDDESAEEEWRVSVKDAGTKLKGSLHKADSYFSSR